MSVSIPCLVLDLVQYCISLMLPLFKWSNNYQVTLSYTSFMTCCFWSVKHRPPPRRDTQLSFETWFITTICNYLYKEVVYHGGTVSYKKKLKSLNILWHCDPWPTVTTQPIRLSTNFMTLIPTLAFTELRVVSMEHLQRVWHASRERLPFRTPGSVPHFGTC